MKMKLLPKTSLGKWSVAMMISCLVLFVIGSVLPWKPGYSGFQIVVHNPLQAVITVLMLAVGIAASGTALISIVKNKERSILAFLAMLVGLYTILGFFGSLLTIFFS